jgi:hypothetical protein
MIDLNIDLLDARLGPKMRVAGVPLTVADADVMHFSDCHAAPPPPGGKPLEECPPNW